MAVWNSSRPVRSAFSRPGELSAGQAAPGRPGWLANISEITGKTCLIMSDPRALTFSLLYIFAETAKMYLIMSDPRAVAFSLPCKARSRAPPACVFFWRSGGSKDDPRTKRKQAGTMFPRYGAILNASGRGAHNTYSPYGAGHVREYFIY